MKTVFLGLSFYSCPRKDPGGTHLQLGSPAIPSLTTTPQTTHSYLQEEVIQVLMAIQKAQSRFPELCSAPKGVFSFPGSPC